MSPDEHAENIVSAVVKRLADERTAQGISKNRLAEMAAIDPKTVAFVENEKRNPTLFTLIKIASALDVSLAELISIAEESN